MQEYKTEKEFLEHYDADKYKKPSLTVDMVIFTLNKKKSENYRELDKKSLQVLMIKRGAFPFKDTWAIPGGFMSVDESVFHAAKRELNEETNLDNVYMEQLYTWGDVNRDPRTRVVSVSYMAVADKDNLDVKAGDDASDAQWFDISYDFIKRDESANSSEYLLTLKNDKHTLHATIMEVEKTYNNITHISYKITESSDIAFDHAKILAYALNRLKTKTEWSDIAFHLMPEEFTIGDLQDVYETILGKQLLAANFRRKIKHMILPTENMSKEAKGHRPALLFKFNKDWNKW